MEEVIRSVAGYLRAQSLSPTQSWLTSFASSIRLGAPLAAQQKTALFRLLATDLQSSLESNGTNTLPHDVAIPNTRERIVAGPVPVQVLDIEDVGRSRWSQVEALEAQERGETTRGREIVRVVPDERLDAVAAPVVSASAGPHKVLLQDVAGTKVYGFELEDLSGISVQMAIGAKLLLRNVVVARGLALLTPGTVEVLGGKVDAWDKAWKADRKNVLRRLAGMSDRDTR